MTPTTLMFCKEDDGNIIRYRKNNIVRRERTNKYMIIVLLTLLALFLTLVVCVLWRFFYMDRKLEAKISIHDSEISYLEKKLAQKTSGEQNREETFERFYENKLIDSFTKKHRSVRMRRSLNEENTDPDQYRKTIQERVKNEKNRRKRDWFVNLKEVMDLYLLVRKNLNSPNKRNEIGNETVAKAFLKSVDKYVNRGENIILDKRESEEDGNEETSESVFPNNIPFTNNELDEEKTNETYQRNLTLESSTTPKPKTSTTTTTTKAKKSKTKTKKLQRPSQKTMSVPKKSQRPSQKTMTVPKKLQRPSRKTWTVPIVNKQREMISKWLSSELPGVTLEEKTESIITYPTPKPYEFIRIVKTDKVRSQINNKEQLKNINNHMKQKVLKNNQTEFQRKNNTVENSTLQEILFPSNENKQENNKYIHHNMTSQKSMTSNNSTKNITENGDKKSLAVSSNSTKTYLNSTKINRNLTSAKNIIRTTPALKPLSISKAHLESTITYIKPKIVSSTLKTETLKNSLSIQYHYSTLTGAHTPIKTLKIAPTTSLHFTPTSTHKLTVNSSQELEDYFTSVEMQTTPTDFESLRKAMEEKINKRNHVQTNTTPTLLSFNKTYTKNNTFQEDGNNYTEPNSSRILKSLHSVPISPTQSFTEKVSDKIHSTIKHEQSEKTHFVSDTPTFGLYTKSRSVTAVVEPTKSVIHTMSSIADFNTTFTRSNISKPNTSEAIQSKHDTNITSNIHSNITSNNNKIHENSTLQKNLKNKTMEAKNITSNKRNMTSSLNMTSNNTVQSNMTQNFNNKTSRSKIQKNTDFEFVTLTTESTTTKDQLEDRLLSSTPKKVKRQTDENKHSIKRQKDLLSTTQATETSRHTGRQNTTKLHKLKLRSTNTPVTLTTPITILLKKTNKSMHDKIEEIINKNKHHKFNTTLDKDVLKFLKNILDRLNKHEIKIASTKDEKPSKKESTKLSWNCRNATTSWGTDYIIGTSRFLSNHKVQCLRDEFLQEFQLIDNKDEFFPLFRYNYKCCRLTLK